MTGSRLHAEEKEAVKRRRREETELQARKRRKMLDSNGAIESKKLRVGTHVTALGISKTHGDCMIT